MELYEKLNDHVATRKNVTPVVNTEARKLNLPRIGCHHKADSNGDQWLLQTYKDLADATNSKDPDSVFDRALMDAAFKVALERKPKLVKPKSRSTGPRTIDAMLKRVWATTKLRVGFILTVLPSV